MDLHYETAKKLTELFDENNYPQLTDEERKLALAVGKDVNFDSMKSALKRVFSKLPSSFSSNGDIKIEEAFFLNKKHSFYTCCKDFLFC